MIQGIESIAWEGIGIRITKIKTVERVICKPIINSFIKIYTCTYKKS